MSDTNSPETVALELMKLIAGKDVANTSDKIKDAKGYYLALYKECLAAVRSGK